MNWIADRADNRRIYMQVVEPFPARPLLPWNLKAWEMRVRDWKQRADAWPALADGD